MKKLVGGQSDQYWVRHEQSKVKAQIKLSILPNDSAPFFPKGFSKSSVGVSLYGNFSLARGARFPCDHISIVNSAIK